jgi:uncharacterized protein YdcH (DUF465 family)
MSLRLRAANTMFVELEAEFARLYDEVDELRGKLTAIEHEAKDIQVLHEAKLRRVVVDEQDRIHAALHRMFKLEYATALEKQIHLRGVT